MSDIDQLIEQYVMPETLDEQLEAWLAEIGPYQFREVPPPAVETSALLVVDMTKPFIDQGRPQSSPSARVILPRVKQVVDAYRAADRPVIWVVQRHHSVEHDRGPLLGTWWSAGRFESSEDTEMATGLDVLLSEKVIVKRRYSGFYQTDLDLTLRCLGVDNVTICGVMTNACPHLTAADAFQRGFRVYFVADGTAAFNRALHVSALCNMAGWYGHVVRAADICGWLAE